MMGCGLLPACADSRQGDVQPKNRSPKLLRAIFDVCKCDDRMGENSNLGLMHTNGVLANTLLQ